MGCDPRLAVIGGGDGRLLLTILHACVCQLNARKSLVTLQDHLKEYLFFGVRVTNTLPFLQKDRSREVHASGRARKL